jgi:hypothetical protein
MRTVKLVLAASTFIGASLIGIILAVSSHVGSAITSMQASTTLTAPPALAREASEGPRGFDNERPGDRHRGRRGRAIEHSARLA